MTFTEPERAVTASSHFYGEGIQVKKRDGFFSVFERIFVEWEDRTLSLDMSTYNFFKLILIHFL